jgi:hypothetical protein
VSVFALLALVFGVLSFLVYLTLWFTFISVLGIIFALCGVVSIYRSEGTLIGMFLARFGLCLSVVSLVSVSVFWVCYDYNLRYEANQFFGTWFKLVNQEDNIKNIPQLRTFLHPYWERQDVNAPEVWWKKQYENKYLHREIHGFIDNKTVRALLVLGGQMKIDLYKTDDVTISNEEQRVTNTYSVTYNDKHDNNSQKTFFVQISAKKTIQPKSQNHNKRVGWELESMPKFILPKEFSTK